MHKTLKKLGAILLALTMLFALNATAFAAETLGQDTNVDDNTDVISDAGVHQEFIPGDPSIPTEDSYAALDPVLRFYKEIVIFNPRTDDTLVYLPNVKFNYTVEPVTVTAGTPKITDERDNEANVKSGVAAALSTSSTDITFSNVNGITTGSTTINATPYVITNANGVAAQGYAEITFVPANFGSAGIYRYKITQAEDATLTRAKAGVTYNTTMNEVRYLDVYVHNNAAGTGLEIYGYVLFEEDSTAHQNQSFDADDKRLATKTNGFVSDNNDSSIAYSIGEEDVDLYLTYNVKIQKITNGPLGDKNNKFPFQATVANSTVVSDPKISYQVVHNEGSTPVLDTDSTTNPTKVMTSGTATIGAAAATVAEGFELDNEDYIYIYGIPGKNNASTVTTKEYNNTFDTYKVSATYDATAVNVKDNDDETSGAAQISMKNTNTAELVAVQTLVIDYSKVQDEIIVTNTLDEVSPTGVVLRVAPYALMLGAGFLFLAISKRRKEENEA